MVGIIVSAVLVIFGLIFLILSINGSDTSGIVISSLLLIFGFLILFQEIKMRKLDKKKKLKYDIPWGVFVVVFVLACLFFGCSYFLYTNLKVKLNSSTAEGMVSNVRESYKEEKEYDSDGNVYYKQVKICDVYVKYNVGDIQYNMKYGSSTADCKYKTGDNVKVYYDKSNPEVIVRTSTLTALVIGTILTGISFVIVLFKLKKTKPKKKRK